MPSEAGSSTSAMRVRLLGIVAALLLLGCARTGIPAITDGSASVAGLVSSESGAPLRGVFVQAKNGDLRMATTVLSHGDGRYQIDGLRPGNYEILVDRAIDEAVQREMVESRTPPSTIRLNAGESKELNFNIRQRAPRWTELSFVEYRDLLPERPGKAEALATCSACHGFRWQSLHPRDREGWRATIHWMRTEFAYFLKEGLAPGFKVTDEKRELIASYLSSVFGPDSDLPEHPDVNRRDISDEALNIVFVDVTMPSSRAFPWSGSPDNKGNVWIPQYNTNQVAQLQVGTGKVQEFRAPDEARLGIHSAVAGPDGMVWLAQAGVHRLGRFDPRTQLFSSYKPPTDPRFGIGQFAHTDIVANGKVWSTGGSLVTSFDPTAQTFAFHGTAPTSWQIYGIAADHTGNIWYARLVEHKLGKIDGKSGKVTEWDPPTTKGGPRRVHVDSKGTVWFGEWDAGKIGSFDPTTETFKEFQIPGPLPRPYGFGIDKQDHIWYYAWGQSELGRLNPSTGRIVQYPVPYVDTTMRDFFADAEGRMWFGAPPANKVGYFYLRGAK